MNPGSLPEQSSALTGSLICNWLKHQQAQEIICRQIYLLYIWKEYISLNLLNIKTRDRRSCTKATVKKKDKHTKHNKHNKHNKYNKHNKHNKHYRN